VWIDQTQDRVEWQPSLLSAFSLVVPLPRCFFIIYPGEIVTMGGGWNWLAVVFSGGLCY
jgi:hypothetical protein